MEGKLLVTPEKLTTTAGEFSANANAVKSLHDEMIAKVNALSGTWTGEAAEAYRSKFGSLQKSMDTINRMINEHVNDLNAMAEQYTSASAAASSIVSELPSSDL